MARQFAFNDEDFTKLRNEIERGGASDPEVVSDYEVRIREGRGVGFREIVGHSEINKSDKQRLLGLIDQQRDEKHFSKLPEYQQAVREVRIAVSRKGPFETLDPQEQKLLLFSTKQLYDRVEKGEDPINVAREIAARIPEEQGGAIGLPDLLPKYPNEEALTRALKEGRVSKQEAAQEALLFKRMREKQRAGEELKKKAQGEREKR